MAAVDREQVFDLLFAQNPGHQRSAIDNRLIEISFAVQKIGRVPDRPQSNARGGGTARKPRAKKDWQNATHPAARCGRPTELLESADT